MSDLLLRCVALVLSLWVTACGGGGAASAGGSPSSVDLQNLGDKINLADGSSLGSAPSSTETTSLRALFVEQARNGYSKTAPASVYWTRKVTLASPFSTRIDGNANGSTRLTVQDPGHGARTGDTVTISNTTAPVNGLPAENLNGTFTITYISADTYSLTVPGNATSNGPALAAGAVLTYRLLECLGSYSYVQTPVKFPDPYDPDPAKREPLVMFERQSVGYAKYTVISELNGCSPGSAKILTTRYFNKDYTWLGEYVTDQDYSVVDGELSLPDTPMKSGDAGPLGTVRTYTSKTRQTYMGRADLSYEVRPDTGNSVFILVTQELYDAYDRLRLRETTVYGRSSDAAKGYQLLRIDARYNNSRQTHVVIQ